MWNPVAASGSYREMSYTLSRPLVVLAALLATAMPAWPIELPQLGAPTTLMAPGEEQRLGRAFMRSLRESVTVSEDEELNAYINALGYRLLAGTDTRGLTFSFFVVEDPQINAFAGPAGHIGVHSGLILAAESEAEVAAVLAHEIGHVTQQHLARTFEHADKLDLQTTAAILAAILLGRNDPKLIEAALATSTALNVQNKLDFSRSQEWEADRQGIEILAHADQDPRAMADFFEQLEHAERFRRGGAPEFLRTHPVTVARLAEARDRAEQFPKRKEGDNTIFRHIQARLRVLTGTDPAQSVRDARMRAEQQNDDEARYELALALTRTNNLTDAATLMSALLERHKDNPTYIAAMTRIDMARREDITAERRLAAALKLYPGHAALTPLYARLLLQMGKAARAVEIMRPFVRDNAERLPPLHMRLLAEAEAASGQALESAQTMAEFHYLNGQTRQAIETLEQAAAKAQALDNAYAQARIKARLEELRAEAAGTTPR